MIHRCDDCGRQHRPPKVSSAPMLREELWAAIATPHDWLCRACCDSRFAAAFGRSITWNDLTDAPINVLDLVHYANDDEQRWLQDHLEKIIEACLYRMEATSWRDEVSRLTAATPRSEKPDEYAERVREMERLHKEIHGMS